MDDGSPALEVGFAIDTGGSYQELLQLQELMGSAEAKMVAEAANIERATGSMVKLGGAAAEFQAFSSAATRELQAINREKANTDRAGERLIKQLEREAAALGQTRDQMRDAKVEAIALAAAEQGNADLADRLQFASRQRAIAAENAAQAEAQAAARAVAAKNAEVAAAERLAREHKMLADAVQASRAAQEADAVAAERLRASTDPLYAITQRLNAELAESTRLYHGGTIGAEEYAHQQAVLQGRLEDVGQQQRMLNQGLGGLGATGKLTGFHMQNLAFQFQDIGLGMFAAAQSGAPLRMVLTTMIQQGSQIYGIMGQAGVGFREVGAAAADMSKKLLLATVANPALMGIAGAAAVAAGAIALLNHAANDDADMKVYAKSLGLTAAEIRKLDNLTVTWGDTTKAVFQVAGEAIWDAIGPNVTDVKDAIGDFFSSAMDQGKAFGNFLIQVSVATFKTFRKNWSSLPEVLGDLFFSAVNAAIDAINLMLRKAIEGLNWLIAQANKILPDAWALPELTAPQIERAANQYAGAARKMADSWSEEFKAAERDYIGDFASVVSERARQNARDRIRAQAEEKGYLDPSSTRARLSAEERAYQNAVKAAREYAAAQQEEADKIGLSARALREYADAAAIAAAPTEALKQAIRDAAAVREAAYGRQSAVDFDKNVMQPLRDELALYGLIGPARDQAALALEKEAFIAQHMDDGIATATARWEEYYAAKSALIARDAAAEREVETIRRIREEMDRLIDAVERSGDAFARAFGQGGDAINESMRALIQYSETRKYWLGELAKDNIDEARYARENAAAQIAFYGDLSEAAQGFFREGTAGYQALQKAEQTFRAIQFALSVRAIAQDAIETGASLANSAARTAKHAVEAVVKAISSLPFPLNLAAGAATAAAIASLGVSIGGAFGGGGSQSEPSNTGTGTVFGDPTAQSASIKNAIDALREVDTVTSTYARQMSASLESIDSQIGGFASLVLRTGNIDANAGITEGFKKDLTGNLLEGLITGGGILSKIPIIGGIIGGIGNFIGSLFGSRTDVTGSGLYGGPQTLGSILSGGFDASYYSDITKTKKFFGIVTGRSHSTQYSAANPDLENQFTLILSNFADAIEAAAGPLGVATDDVEARLNGFVVNIGKIDLKGLTGAEIEDKLTAVFGAAADNMANAAFPGIRQFQQAGEGMFETLVRVASTIEAVGNTLDLLGQGVGNLGIEATLALADQFDSVSGLVDAADAYFQAYYTKEEQAAAKAAQMAKVFEGLGLAMPGSIAAFRQLVEAQDLTTAAGQATYATLLKLAPAFADVQEALTGGKSAADIASERQSLQRQLLELQGDTAAIRELDLAKLDESNRALQQQIWAIQDAKDAAAAADELRQAWQSVGDSILDEVNRIRGLANGGTSTDFATLQGQFNAATASARSGDQDAAKSLPGLSQALLSAAALVATSRQELDRVQAATAASLEATYAAITGFAGGTAAASIAAAGTPSGDRISSQPVQVSIDDLLNAAATNQVATAPASASGDMASEIRALREEVAQLRSENNAGHATTAANTGSMKRTLDNVTQQSGGDAISIEIAA
ncbi:hypothetical protein [Sphingosinithalassobacter portus]|uniref:hypothetical protein n=1 Tax=Stakelama portus TaxID=2676234 RepID=UPI000D6E1C02|nr:hypothetical protein [Sphingosinithalassobacter portus]